MRVLTKDVHWGNVFVRLEFNRKDVWIGCYWDRGAYDLSIWICFVPCFPIAISIEMPYKASTDNEDY